MLHRLIDYGYPNVYVVSGGDKGWGRCRLSISEINYGKYGVYTNIFIYILKQFTKIIYFILNLILKLKVNIRSNFTSRE